MPLYGEESGRLRGAVRDSKVLWNCWQRHERWRDCGLELYVTVCMVMRNRIELLIMLRL